ncbi:hypothetical protein ACMA5I_10415 [Paracoccaceae bacterium GXU_MW_L88]
MLKYMIAGFLALSAPVSAQEWGSTQTARDIEGGLYKWLETFEVRSGACRITFNQISVLVVFTSPNSARGILEANVFCSQKPAKIEPFYMDIHYVSNYQEWFGLRIYDPEPSFSTNSWNINWNLKEGYE